MTWAATALPATGGRGCLARPGSRPRPTHGSWDREGQRLLEEETNAADGPREPEKEEDTGSSLPPVFQKCLPLAQCTQAPGVESSGKRSVLSHTRPSRRRAEREQGGHRVRLASTSPGCPVGLGHCPQPNVATRARPPRLDGNCTSHAGSLRDTVSRTIAET